MIPFRMRCMTGRPIWGVTKSTFVLFLLFLQAQALHCHRKHDHSTDVLLRSDTSSLGSSSRMRHSGHYQHENPSETLSEHSAAKLVQLQDSDTSDNSNKNDTWTSDSSNGTRSGGKIVAFCPARCHCDFTPNDKLQVVCKGHFIHDFPLEKLRKDVEILHIEPEVRCVSVQGKGDECDRLENQISLGPIYQHLRLLKELRIKYSQVPNIGHRTMFGLSGLRVLDLSHNRLTNVVEQYFEGLYSLKELCLANNQIKSMVSAAFRHVPMLEALSLRNNLLEELAPRIFYKLQNLQVLDLSGNRLQHIDGAVFVDIPNLEVFSCSKCFLVQLPLPKNANMNKLSHLYLSHNSIESLDDIHSNFLNQVQHLDLAHNKIKEIGSRHFHENSLLKSLLLPHNNVSVMENCVFCNTSLQILDLAHNRMGYINENIVHWDIRSLNELRLSSNVIPIEQIEKLLQRMPALEKVSLDATGIVSVPPTIFDFNPRLKHVNMSGNLLITLEIQVFNHLEWLEVLDLSSNYIVGPSEEFFHVARQKSRLRMIYLQKNHFICDKCHILPLLQWLQSSLQYWGTCFDRGNDLCLKCSRPNEFMHMPIENLILDELPECQTLGGSMMESEDTLFDEGNTNNLAFWPPTPSSFDTNSPYLALAVAGILLTAVAVIVLVRYRQYGVYMTHEEDQLVDDDDVLRNPVVVLDRNSESYINLRYPVLAPPPPLNKKKCAMESEVCATSFKIKFEDSV